MFRIINESEYPVNEPLDELTRQTLLMYMAVFGGQAGGMSRLIEDYGADPKATDIAGRTFLHYWTP